MHFEKKRSGFGSFTGMVCDTLFSKLRAAGNLIPKDPESRANFFNPYERDF